MSKRLVRRAEHQRREIECIRAAARLRAEHARYVSLGRWCVYPNGRFTEVEGAPRDIMVRWHSEAVPNGSRYPEYRRYQGYRWRQKYVGPDTNTHFEIWVYTETPEQARGFAESQLRSAVGAFRQGHFNALNPHTLEVE